MEPEKKLLCALCVCVMQKW